MPAASESGVGPGSADGYNKGSEHMTLDINKLIGFHGVTGGLAVLSGGAATVTFPKSLSADKDKYIVIVSSLASYARLNAKNNDSDGFFTSFTIAGTGTDTVQWAVFRLDA